jgi:hypothetical protein
VKRKKRKGPRSGDEELLRILMDPRLARKLETRVLKRLAHTPPNQWPDWAWAAIIRATREQGAVFWKRLCSGTTDLARRRLEPDRDDSVVPFLRDNWDALKDSNPGNLPGLREWHPLAAIKFLQDKKGFWCGHLSWYKNLRLSLGLKPKLPYSVKAPKT